MDPVLRLGTGVELLAGDQFFPLQTRHERAILLRLAMAGGEPVSRAVLAAQIWPEMSEAASKLNLRQRLHSLRRVLGARLVTDRQWVRLIGVALVTEPEIPPEAWLSELEFPWMPEVRAQLRGGIPIGGEGLHPLRPEAVEEWLETLIHRGESASFPYHGRVSELARAESNATDTYERDLWRCALTYAAVFAHEPQLARDAVDRTTDESARSAFTLEWAGNAAHSQRDYHACLAYFFEAERLYQANQCTISGVRMRFKVHRVMVDMGTAGPGERGLSELAQRYRSQMPDSLQRMLDFNLVFAHANAGNVADGEAALARARAAAPELTPETAFLEANACTLYQEQGLLPDAAAALLRYADLIRGTSDQGGKALLYVRTAELLARAEDTVGCAAALTLVQRNEEAGFGLSAMNRTRINRELNGLMARQGGRPWLMAIQEARRLTDSEADAMLMTSLNLLAQGR